MGKIAPDHSLERDGRPLPDWLMDLVAEDQPTRKAAGEALQAIWFGVPGYRTELDDLDFDAWDPAGQQVRFGAAVREAVEAPGFPKREFVGRLCLLRVALQEDWLDRVDRARAGEDRLDHRLDRLMGRALTAEAEPDREHAARRYMRVVCASMARSNTIYVAAESSMAVGMASFLVFKALDSAFLADRPALRVVLGQPQLRYQALEALGRIGPAAADFAGELLEQLDRAAAEGLNRFDGARALGAIARDVPEVVDALLSRLREGPEARRAAAASALVSTGPALAGRLDEAVDLLLEASRGGDARFAAIPALASVGRDREDALARVLRAAAPRPPRTVGEGWSAYDEVMAERGVALDALAYFGGHADRAVRALTAALDDFEEYDPDWSYDGDHGRIFHALKQYGPAAAPAVSRLARFFEEWLVAPEAERDWPKAALELVAAIGPPAAPILPALQRIRDTSVEPGEPLDPEAELARAIIAVERRADP